MTNVLRRNRKSRINVRMRSSRPSNQKKHGAHKNHWQSQGSEYNDTEKSPPFSPDSCSFGLDPLLK